MIRFTYLATREHPASGLLLKVGSSSDPERRCSELGATLHKPVLPERCEAELHAFLQHKRVWSKSLPSCYLQPDPVFPAHTEWFYIDPFLGEWLRAYAAFARATAALLSGR